MQQPLSPTADNQDDILEGSEHVIVTIKKHWAGVVGIYLAAILVVTALVTLGFYVLPQMGLSKESQTLLVAGLLAVGAILIFILMTIVYVYNQSKIILTDLALVQTLYLSLFNKKISRLSMSNVEDVSAEQKGIVSNMLGYGTLFVQSGGQEDNFVFKYCPMPNVYAERILEARQKYAEAHPR